MWPLPLTKVVLVALAFGVPTTFTPLADQSRGVGEWVHASNSPSSQEKAVYCPGSLSSWDGLVHLPGPSLSGRYDTLNLTAVESLSEALCSPPKVAEGGSRTTMPSTVVSMVLLCNTTILLVPPAPGGMPAAVMAVQMAWMHAPFDGSGPSQWGGRALLSWRRVNSI
jgi:hypothetical protein